ncbi:aryl-sulfate sulfotransferase [Candidatus Dojkabacteria bacterium]|uniref:Aryl-sulfate sulfotransferase n=1 Tax=Candidatus Dojkabacteria bacterium TaxID=2099670 RepID=A0A955L6U1_9BACT|nr:aryl-sulfate sulfotransferase [Candidatus Dojkabacteria bacterium]
MPKRLKTFLLLLILLLLATTSGYLVYKYEKENPVLFLDKENVADGYTLFSPLYNTNTYLINNEGKLVHKWESDYPPGNSLYLLENGNLLRTALVDQDKFTRGAGGRVELISWDGELLWEFDYNSDQHIQHHDIELLPNGNILILAWDEKSNEEALSKGMSEEYVKEGAIITETIIEVNPETNEIVWKWDTWDHIVQDADSEKPNYGVIEENPRKVNINYYKYSRDIDWNHANSVDYNEEFDQILISVREFNEIWVIDHSTTTEEAMSSDGGQYGFGGDLLYRWGNLEAYNNGEEADRQLFKQHDAEWIAEGLPGAGHVTIFDNGQNNSRQYSRALEISLPVNEEGVYEIEGNKFADAEIIWQYGEEEDDRFYSYFISGTQRLRNGNTLITNGADGIFFEVDSDKNIVWKYANPIDSYSEEREEYVKFVFRADKYPSDYPAFDDKDLSSMGRLSN